MSDIDEIKSRINIVDIISERVSLKKAGRHFKANCPFHNEKTPSFIVSPDRQIFKCFGCGVGGSVIDFVMAYYHIDFVEALEMLAQKAGIKLEGRALDTPEAKLKHSIYELNHLASEFYQYLLTKHNLGDKARLYLKNRGISDKSIQTFSLGYSPNSWEGLLKFLRKKGYEEELMEKAGLVIATKNSRAAGARNRYYDRFRGRVMFTLKDHRGNVVGFSGRLLDPDAQEAKYINTSETLAYNKSNVLYGLDVTREAIIKANEAIIMEGEFDVISSFQVGVSNAVAIKGSALTEGHVHLLRRFTERLVFALDSDMAGDSAARRGIELADQKGLDMKVAIISDGKDPDEVARTHPSALKKIIKDAVPIYDYFISSAVSRFDKESAYGKKKISEELLPILSKVDNSIVRSHYIKKLSAQLDTAESILAEDIQKIRQGKVKKYAGSGANEPVAQTGYTRLHKLEMYILSFLVQGKTKEWTSDLVGVLKPADFESLPIRRIIDHLESYFTHHDAFSIETFGNELPEELRSSLDEAFLWDIGEIIDHDIRAQAEWEKAISSLRLEQLKRKIQVITKSLHDRDASADRLQALSEDLRSLTNQLRQLEKAG